MSVTTLLPNQRAQAEGAADATPVLSVRDLRTTFTAGGQQVDAIRGIDLELHRGKVDVLLGESGSGKSVTARSILRLYGPSAVIDGSVMFAGQDLTTLTDRQMQDLRGPGISLVPQDPTGSLDPLRRVGAQIVEVLRIHRIVESKREAHGRAEELLAQVGLPDPKRAARSFPHELSGGMRQRVAIALAISCDPAVLIADEPTTALDVTVQAQILELFVELTERLGSAMLMITHDVGVARDVADRVSVMYAGRIVEHGPVTSVLDQPMHPYTRALLAAVPTPEVARGDLVPIKGQPPVSGVNPPGCAFAARCPSALSSCSADVPELRFVRESQLVACPVVEVPVEMSATDGLTTDELGGSV